MPPSVSSMAGQNGSARPAVRFVGDCGKLTLGHKEFTQGLDPLL